MSFETYRCAKQPCDTCAHLPRPLRECLHQWDCPRHRCLYPDEVGGSAWLGKWTFYRRTAPQNGDEVAH